MISPPPMKGEYMFESEYTEQTSFVAVAVTILMFLITLCGSIVLTGNAILGCIYGAFGVAVLMAELYILLSVTLSFGKIRPLLLHSTVMFWVYILYLNYTCFAGILASMILMESLMVLGLLFELVCWVSSTYD